jgi:hypothetical protein
MMVRVSFLEIPFPGIATIEQRVSPFPSIVIEGEPLFAPTSCGRSTSVDAAHKGIQGGNLPFAGVELAPGGRKLARKGVGAIALARKDLFLIR